MKHRPVAPQMVGAIPSAALRLLTGSQGATGGEPGPPAARPLVLLVRQQVGAEALIQRLSLLGFDVCCARASELPLLRQAFCAQHMRAVIVHLEELRAVGPQQIEPYRQLNPAMPWLLAWDQTPPSDGVDLMLRFQVRGCLEGNNATLHALATQAVAHGEYWLPRWLGDALYRRLLSAAHDDLSLDPSSEPAVRLTSREAQTQTLMQAGLTNKQIAAQLQISVNTVKKHLKNLTEKQRDQQAHRR